MDRVKKISCLFITVMASASAFAQAVKEAPVDFMRSNGKIYVVVAIVLTILIGLFLYLIRLDRKISRVEESDNSKLRS